VLGEVRIFDGTPAEGSNGMTEFFDRINKINRILKAK
jgi:hypothetical protein